MRLSVLCVATAVGILAANPALAQTVVVTPEQHTMMREYVYKGKIKPRKKIAGSRCRVDASRGGGTLAGTGGLGSETCGLTITYTPVTASTSSSHPAAEWSISSNFPPTTTTGPRLRASHGPALIGAEESRSKRAARGGRLGGTAKKSYRAVNSTKFLPVQAVHPRASRAPASRQRLHRWRRTM